jgi:hypothetical protein
MLGLGADEFQIVLGEDFSKARVFGEEPVAGVHGVRTGDLASRKQRRDVEIAVL